MPSSIPIELAGKLAPIRLFLCDVDGILTDGSVFMGNQLELKRFHIPDGLGLRLLQRSGVKVGWISRRPSQATEERARDLKIDFLVQCDGEKVAAAEQLIRQSGLTWPQTCYAGDDVVDLGLLRRAGVAFAVPNGIEETKQIADYTTKNPGGHGAVREIVELILKAQNRWENIIREFSEEA